MPYFRKKPVVIHATQVQDAFEVQTMEGLMKGKPGDYLVTGVRGEFYPCKPDIFEATYELVE